MKTLFVLASFIAFPSDLLSCVPEVSGKLNEIWIMVSPDVPGERTQLAGVAEALGLPFRFVRPSSPLVRDFSGLPPRLVFLKGAGKGEAAALRLKEQGAFLVKFARAKFNPEPFDLVVTAFEPKTSAPNVLRIPTATSRVTVANLRRYRGGLPWPLESLPEPRVAVLLGGHINVRYPFSEDRIESLRLRLSELQQDQGLSFVLVGSRRLVTLPEKVSVGLAPEKTWVLPWRGWGEDENPMLRILANVDGVIATGDSLSMMSEAASVGKRAYIFGADLGMPYHRRFATQILEAGFARELPESGPLQLGDATPATSTQMVADRIRELLESSQK